MGVFDGAALLISLRREGTTLKLTRGTYTALDTGTGSLAIDTTYRIEMRILIADSGGRVEVKIDNVSDIDFTGDTKEGTSTQFNKVRLGYCGLAAYTSYAYFDNLIMDDAAWIGDLRIQAVVPTAAGNATGWTPSAGSNYACVDEIPASDTDYNSIDANGVVDTFVMGNLAGNIDSVKAVQVQSRTRTEGSPTPTNLNLAIRSGGTTYYSGDKSVPSTEKGLREIWVTDPATSVAWLESGVNAIEAGVRSAA